MTGFHIITTTNQMAGCSGHGHTLKFLVPQCLITLKRLYRKVPSDHLRAQGSVFIQTTRTSSHLTTSKLLDLAIEIALKSNQSRQQGRGLRKTTAWN